MLRGGAGDIRDLHTALAASWPGDTGLIPTDQGRSWTPQLPPPWHSAPLPAPSLSWLSSSGLPTTWPAPETVMPRGSGIAQDGRGVHSPDHHGRPHPPPTAWILNTHLPLPGCTAWESGPRWGLAAHQDGPLREGLGLGLGPVGAGQAGPAVLGWVLPTSSGSKPVPTHPRAGPGQRPPCGWGAPCGGSPGAPQVLGGGGSPCPAPPTSPASVRRPLAQPLRPPADSGHCWCVLVHLEGSQPSWGRLGWGWGRTLGGLERRGAGGPRYSLWGRWSILQPKVRIGSRAPRLPPPSPASMPHVHRHSPSELKDRGFSTDPWPPQQARGPLL